MATGGLTGMRISRVAIDRTQTNEVLLRGGCWSGSIFEFR